MEINICNRWNDWTKVKQHLEKCDPVLLKKIQSEKCSPGAALNMAGMKYLKDGYPDTPEKIKRLIEVITK